MSADAPCWETIEMPEGACDCQACRKLAVMALEPWTWENDLRLRPEKRR